MIPKFKIGDVVSFKNEFSFNQAYETVSIGKVESIHIKYGKGPFLNRDESGIIYSISGCGYMPTEEEINLF